MNVIRVVVVGDIRLYREGVATFLRQVEDFAVVATGETGDEALALVADKRPDVLLLDLALPGSLDIIRRITEVPEPPCVVVLAVPEVEQSVLGCIEAGVAGYVPRDGGLDDLVNVVRSAARGESMCSPRMIARTWARLAQLSRTQAPPSPVEQLTQREREILQRIEAGHSNKEIAAQLSIELATVKNHVHNILEKLHVHRRGEAVAAMRRSGVRSASPRI